jgi:hypothetical protein
LWSLLSCLSENLWISCLIVGIFRSIIPWGIRNTSQYLLLKYRYIVYVANLI